MTFNRFMARFAQLNGAIITTVSLVFLVGTQANVVVLSDTSRALFPGGSADILIALVMGLGIFVGSLVLLKYIPKNSN